MGLWKGSKEELDQYMSKRKRPGNSKFYPEWKSGGNGEGVSQEVLAFKQKAKAITQEKIQVLQAKLDEIDSLTQKFLENPEHFDYQLFLENSDLEEWKEADVKELVSGKTPFLERYTDNDYGSGLTRLYRTDDGGLAEVSISPSYEATEWESAYDLQEVDMDNLEFEDHAGSDIFPGFYDEWRQKDFESEFIQGLTKEEKALYKVMTNELATNHDFYKNGRLIPDNQKALCRKIRELRFKGNFSNQDFKDLQKNTIEKIMKDQRWAIPDDYSTSRDDYTVSQLEEEVAERCADQLSEFGIKDFKTKSSGDEAYYSTGAEAYNGEVKVFNRLAGQ